MNGSAAWTLEDLERVGKLFGESIVDVVALGVAPSSVPRRSARRIDKPDLRRWIGARVTDQRPDVLVAIRSKSGWQIRSAREVGQEKTFALERLQISAGAAERKLVAVLDDDVDPTDSICAHLSAGDYDARRFYRTADLQGGIKTIPFDAYVIDWVVGESSTEEAIESIRADKTRIWHPVRRRFGRCSTGRRAGAGRVGIPSWNTTASDLARPVAPGPDRRRHA